jgi:phage tail protein X
MQNDIHFVFADTADSMCWHNLHFTRSIVSSGIAAAASDQEFAQAYERCTAIYAPFVPNTQRSSGFIS